MLWISKVASNFLTNKINIYLGSETVAQLISQFLCRESNGESDHTRSADQRTAYTVSVPTKYIFRSLLMFLSPEISGDQNLSLTRSKQ